MTENMEIWDKLGKTDPKHTKGFKRAGGFGGTAIKPIYTEQKMTEVFGAAGKGWGMGEPSFQTVSGNDGQIAVYCTVSLWWTSKRPANPAISNMLSEPALLTHTVYGVGGDMVVVKQSNGLRTDDEAFKKAFTDAIGNAMKHIGMSADVHMGLFDDSKYVQERNAEEAEKERPEIIPADGKKASRANARDIYQALAETLNKARTVDKLKEVWRLNSEEIEALPTDWHENLVTFAAELRDALEAKAEAK